MDRGAWRATVHGVARVEHDLATKPPPIKDTIVLTFAFHCPIERSTCSLCFLAIFCPSSLAALRILTIFVF